MSGSATNGAKPPIWLRRSRLSPLTATVVLVVVGALGWFVTVGNGLPDSRVPRADSTADWLVTTAFLNGDNPYTDMRVLAEAYNVTYGGPVEDESAILSHPRTPGALVLMTPLTLFTPSGAYLVMVGVGLFAIGLGLLVFVGRFNLSYLALGAGLLYATLAAPARWSLEFGTQSPLLFLCVAIFIATQLRGDSAIGGLALGIAATLKVFPLILVVILLKRRQYRALTATLLTIVALNLPPLLMPNVSMNDLLATASSAVETWFGLPSNIGLASQVSQLFRVDSVAVLAIGALALIAVFAAYIWRDRPHLVVGGFLLAIATLASPLSWPHYLLALAPVMVVIGDSYSTSHRETLALLAAVLLTVPLVGTSFYTFALLLIAVILMFGRFVRRPTAPSALDLDYRDRPLSHVAQTGMESP